MSDAALGIGRRVLVTGMAGSGKSTFSRSLAAKTGLPVIHLDLHFWKPGWVAPSELEWREKQSGLLAGDAWIADGNYHETLDLRLERADTVVFLDTPWWVCAGRAFLRGLRNRSGRCPKGATIRPGDGCATSGVWPSSSGGTAAQSPSANTRSSRSTGSTRSFTRSGPNGQLRSFSTGWTSSRRQALGRNLTVA